METKSSNLSVLLEEGVKRGRVKMDLETEIRYDQDHDSDDDHDGDGDDDQDHDGDDDHDDKWTNCPIHNIHFSLIADK